MGTSLLLIEKVKRNEELEEAREVLANIFSKKSSPPGKKGEKSEINKKSEIKDIYSPDRVLTKPEEQKSDGPVTKNLDVTKYHFSFHPEFL